MRRFEALGLVLAGALSSPLPGAPVQDPDEAVYLRRFEGTGGAQRNGYDDTMEKARAPLVETGDVSMTIRRSFVDLDHGQSDCRSAGEGPPILLLHASPGSSIQLAPKTGRSAWPMTASMG